FYYYDGYLSPPGEQFGMKDVRPRLTWLRVWTFTHLMFRHEMCVQDVYRVRQCHLISDTIFRTLLTRRPGFSPWQVGGLVEQIASMEDFRSFRFRNYNLYFGPSVSSLNCASFYDFTHDLNFTYDLGTPHTVFGRLPFH
ncbi:hypothetical protein L9F63_014670, partial [Diploptera punctata]